MRIPCSLLVSLALSSPVLADDDTEEPTLSPPRSFNTLAFRFGDRDIDGVYTSYDGAALTLGRRFGNLTLYGEGELGYQRREHLDGLAASLSLHARQTLCPFVMGDRRDEIRIPCWLDVGLGWSSLVVRGATMPRPVLSLGVGGGVEAASKRRRGGMSLGIAIELSPVTKRARVLASELTDTRVRSVEQPPSSDRVDVGVTCSATFLFGR